VLSLSLPGNVWANPAYQFGSGFLNGNGPAHLPPHSTFDLSVGKRFGERWSISANAVNIGNARYLWIPAIPSAARITSIRGRFTANCAIGFTFEGGKPGKKSLPGAFLTP